MQIIETVQEAMGRLETAGAGLVVDLSSIHRIDPSGVQALEKLASAAGEKHVNVFVRGVDVDVYKVLKLVKLAPRFSFIA